MLTVDHLTKSFVLHLQGGTRLSVLKEIDLTVRAGECVSLIGPSGAGKSTLLRLLYANYKPDGGKILVRDGEEWVDLVKTDPRRILDLRKRTLGYVSQFLHVIPRVPAIDIVMEPLRGLGVSMNQVQEKAEVLLARLNIPSRLWRISPTTFSGGEQQRINIARCLIVSFPILLLDEPTAALDGANRKVVVELIRETRERGAAVIGVFHDEEVRRAVSSRLFELTPGEVEI